MSNWCLTQVVVSGLPEKLIKITDAWEFINSGAFCDAMLAHEFPDREKREEYGYKASWYRETTMALLYYAFGHIPAEAAEWGSIRCYPYEEETPDGYIVCQDKLVFDFYSAGDSEMDPLVSFLEVAAGVRLTGKPEDTLSLRYVAQEPGEGYFITNIPECVGKYCCENIASDNGYTEEELITLASRKFHKKYTSLEEVLNKVGVDGPYEYLPWEEELTRFAPEDRWRMEEEGKSFRNSVLAAEKETER